LREASAVIAGHGAGFAVPQNGSLLLQDDERGRRIVIVIGQAAIEDQFEVEEAGVRCGAVGPARRPRVTRAM
jgi:hypothetical protein